MFYRNIILEKTLTNKRTGQVHKRVLKAKSIYCKHFLCVKKCKILERTFPIGRASSVCLCVLIQGASLMRTVRLTHSEHYITKVL